MHTGAVQLCAGGAWYYPAVENGLASAFRFGCMPRTLAVPVHGPERAERHSTKMARRGPALGDSTTCFTDVCIPDAKRTGRQGSCSERLHVHTCFLAGTGPTW